MGRGIAPWAIPGPCVLGPACTRSEAPVDVLLPQLLVHAVAVIADAIERRVPLEAVSAFEAQGPIAPMAA